MKSSKRAPSPPSDSSFLSGSQSESETVHAHGTHTDDMANMLDLLLDIHSRLDFLQMDLDELRAAKVSQSVRSRAPSVNRTCTSSKTRHSRHQPDPDPPPPQLADSSSLGELSEEVRERVARRVRQLPLLGRAPTHQTMPCQRKMNQPPSATENR